MALSLSNVGQGDQIRDAAGPDACALPIGDITGGLVLYSALIVGTVDLDTTPVAFGATGTGTQLTRLDSFDSEVTLGTAATGFVDCTYGLWYAYATEDQDFVNMTDPPGSGWGDLLYHTVFLASGASGQVPIFNLNDNVALSGSAGISDEETFTPGTAALSGTNLVGVCIGFAASAGGNQTLFDTFPGTGNLSVGADVDNNDNSTSGNFPEWTDCDWFSGYSAAAVKDDGEQFDLEAVFLASGGGTFDREFAFFANMVIQVPAIANISPDHEPYTTLRFTARELPNMLDTGKLDDTDWEFLND